MCREKLLSAYYDHELPVEVRCSIAEHVRECPICSEELAIFKSLSGIIKGLDDPNPPQSIWAGIEADLDADGHRGPKRYADVSLQRPPRKCRVRLLAITAVVMIAAGVAWIVSGAWHGSGDENELAANFQEYLGQFDESLDTAQSILLAQYQGRPVDLAQAATLVGYQPAVAAGLPKRYSLDSVYVLKMPCCTCVQSICRRDDGRVFVIFEHAEEHPAWLGGRPTVETQCGGCPCSVMQADRGLVASWKVNSRQLTIVGAQGLEEIVDLITHFQTDPPEA